MTDRLGRGPRAALAVLLLLAAGLLAAAPGRADSFEPNDTAATATVLENGVEVESWISTADDPDWFTFVVAVMGTIQIRLHDLPADYDLILFVKNPMTGEIESFEGWRATRSGLDDEELSIDTYRTGTFYVLVFGFSGAHDADAPYRLSVQWPDGSPSMPPSVTLLVPNGGETYPSGLVLSITYDVTDPDTPDAHLYAKVLLSTNSGVSWSDADSWCYNMGSCRWTVPSTRTTRARLRVIVGDGQNETYDDSDADFTILTQPPQVQVLSPNGGEILRSGEVETILYAATDPDTPTSGLEMRFEFSSDGGETWDPIGQTPSENTGKFWWLTNPHNNTRHGRVRAIVSDGQDHGEDVSDSDFAMSQAPTIYVSSPRAGEDWLVGTPHDILFTVHDGDTEPMDLRIDFAYSTDAGTTWIDIATDQPYIGGYRWVIPDTPSTRARVKVEAFDGLHWSSKTTSNFDLVGYPDGQNVVGLPNVTVPAAGEIEIPLTLDNDNDIRSLKTEIAFDPTVVGFLGAEHAGRGSGLNCTATVPQSGTLMLTLGAPSGTSLAPGTGTIASLRFGALADSGASTTLTLGGLSLRNPIGTSLRVTGVSGSIAVTARPAPVLNLSLIRNPGRARSFQVFVTAEGHLDELRVVTDGVPISMEEIAGRPGFYHGNVNLLPGTPSATVTADGAFGVHFGEAQATIEF